MKNKYSMIFLAIFVCFSFNAQASHFDWDGPDAGVDDPFSTPGVNTAIVESNSFGTLFGNLDGGVVFDANANQALFDGGATSLEFNHEHRFYVDPAGFLSTRIEFRWDLGFVSPLSIAIDGTSLFPGTITTGPGSPQSVIFTSPAFGPLAVGYHVLSVSGEALAAARNYDFILGHTEVPIPAAVWLFGSALLGLTGISTRRKSLATEA